MPTSTSNAEIFNGGTATITTTGDVCSTLSLGNSAGSGSVQMTGGSLGVSGSDYLGYSGTGNFAQSGGTNTGGYLYVGYNSGGNGTYSLSGTGQLSTLDGEYVGYSGTGTFTQTGGTNTMNFFASTELCLGGNAGSSGTYSLSGSGLLSANTEYVGWSGTGSFTQSGGTNTLSSYLYVGNNAGSNGTYSLSGSGLLSAEEVTVGSSGTGNFTQSGGTNVSGQLQLGPNAGSSGTYSLSSSGLLTAQAGEYVGSSGTGNFTQSGGTNALSDGLELGVSPGGSGTYNLSGGQLSVTGTEFGWEYVGGQGVGNFTQSGGTNTTSSNGLYLGYTARGRGTYRLSGSGLLSIPIEYVAYSGTGNFTQSGGTNTIPGALYLGYSAGSSGTYSLSGSGLLSAPNEYVGYSSSATALFQQTGGTNSVRCLSIGSSGRYQLSGGTLQINGGIINAGVFDASNGPGTLERQWPGRSHRRHVAEPCIPVREHRRKRC